MKQLKVMPLTLTIAGRPNVGKSTLFNRLVGKAMALVHDTPGVTRDWREGDGRLFDLRFRVFDTAGLEDRRPKGSMAARTAAHTREVLMQSDVILLMVDGREGLTSDDKIIAREMRKTGKPIILLVNKCEGIKLPHGYDEALVLGFEKVLPISAVHGEGMHELYEALLPFISAKNHHCNAIEVDDAESKHLHIAIVGRPNAGKSTLVNKLIGKERMLTGPEPGLTRDAIHIKWKYKGHPIRLVDTAGIRRRSRIEEKLEKMSVQESLRAIRLAHVVILVLDAMQPFDKQDYSIAQHVADEGRALVLAANKWDAVKHKAEVLRMIRKKTEASLAQVTGVPIVPISALKGEGLDKLMKEVMRIYEVWNMRVPTGKLNRWLENMEVNHPPPVVSGRRVKLRYVTQIKSRPPTFALWVNKPVDLPDSYSRFLIGGLRKTFRLEGVPIRLLLRKGENPFERGKRRH